MLACGIIALTCAAELALQFMGAPLSRELLDETGKPQEIHKSEKRPPLPDEDFRIRGDNVGPLRRNRANRAVVDAQQESFARPVMAFADADELPAGERMKGVSHADKLRRSDGNVCFLTRVTSGLKTASSAGRRSKMV